MSGIAILGCGSIGMRHLHNLRELGAGSLMVYDPQKSAQDAAVALGIRGLSSPLEVWQQRPQIVFICTPSASHTAFALEAARSGAHLFIEKPLAHTLQGLDCLAAAIAENGCIDLVGCNMRFHPGPLELKRRLGNGEIGTILSARFHVGSFLPRWRPGQDYHTSYSASPSEGGAILDCIHEIDLALWLLGRAELRAAAARPARSIGLQTDGLAELILEHESGALSSLHLNFVQRNYHRSIELIGEQGTLHWDYSAGAIKHYDEDGCLVMTSFQPDDWKVNQMYFDEVDYFLTKIRSNKPTFCSVASATETLQIALQARESFRSSR